ncbi:MAG: OB-fold nucleic acid binding domain-containing protein, partial [Reyranella sp.]|nr:OB-fold nucleic acid binding domain-containing protein [Reyranella sp.]
APAQLVRDAQENGVEVRPPDINASIWDCTLEPSSQNNRCALRLGLRQVAGLSEKDVDRMVAQRATPYRDPADLWRRAGLTKRQIIALARADAFASLGLSRRDVLWAVRGFSDVALPLLDYTSDPEPAVTLPDLTLGEQVVDDYGSFSMSLRKHPLALLRPAFSARGISSTSVLEGSKNGDIFTLAGLVLVRQRPGTASGVVFVTIEDEHGIANLVVWPKVFDAHRRIVMGSRLLGVRGKIQREGEGDYVVIHLVAEQLWDWSTDLDRIADIDETFRLTLGCGDEVRTDPRDRRVAVPEANATRHRSSRTVPAALDRPKIRIASRDFH